MVSHTLEAAGWGSPGLGGWEEGGVSRPSRAEEGRGERREAAASSILLLAS